MEVIQERAERRMIVREDTGKSHQLRASFRKDCEKRLAVHFRESRLPQGGALSVNLVIEVIARQDSTVRGTPAFGMQMRDGCGVVLGGVAQGHHRGAKLSLEPYQPERYWRVR